MTKRALRSGHRAARQLAHRGARIQRVVPRIGEPVEPHRRAARGDHRHDDPHDTSGNVARRPVVQAMQREERAGQRKRQRKDRVAEADERCVGAEPVHDYGF